jgi:RNA polymerase sigma-70 factor (ECF subfamily)
VEGQIDTFETFENLYRSEYRAMLKHAGRFGHRSHDVVQEAYAALWSIMRTRDVENPRALLYKIAENQALKGYDASRRRNAVEIPAGLSHDLAEIEEELAVQRAHTADREEFTAAFDSALRALPGDERDAFILTDLRGLSVREAEGVLDTSYRTIHRRADSARLTLREEIR